MREIAGEKSIWKEERSATARDPGENWSLPNMIGRTTGGFIFPWNEVVAYSLHVRGFTKHSSSKAVHKGTYLGVIEKIPYLKELGINQIQCMRSMNLMNVRKQRPITGVMDRHGILLRKKLMLQGIRLYMS